MTADETGGRDGSADGTDDGMRTNRRTVLRSAVAAGLLGAGATGTASAAGWRELTLCAAGSPVFSYRVTVDGAVKRGGTYESDDGDTVGGDYVEGAVAEKRCDSFLIKGDIVDTELRGPGRVLLDGEVVEDTTGGGGGGGQTQREITFCAADDPVFTYRATFSGGVERGGTYQSDSGDTVGDNYVKGAVAESRCDSFLFTGDLTNLSLSGPGTVQVDGDVIRDTTGGGANLPNVVVVSSPNTDAFLDYQFRVTGDLVNLEPDEDSGQARDEVIDLGDRGTRVRGNVSTGDDRFAFSGRLIRENVPSAVRLDVSRR